MNFYSNYQCAYFVKTFCKKQEKCSFFKQAAMEHSEISIKITLNSRLNGSQHSDYLDLLRNIFWTAALSRGR